MACGEMRSFVSAAVVVALVWVVPMASASCFPALFNFGDSQSDTGGIQAAFPGYTPAEYHPYGDTYFRTPQNRYSDGRLLVDFVAEGLGLPLLDPYLSSVTSDFKHGANFATAGATARDVKYLSPFHLRVQTLHFLAFVKGVKKMWNQETTLGRSSTDVRSAVLNHAARVSRLPPLDFFHKALFTINIGGNDFTFGYTHGYSVEKVEEEIIPEAVESIAHAIRRMHDEGGGRNFLIWDMEPMGCLPYIKTLIKHKPEDLNALNCLPHYDDGARFFNNLLNETLADLREKYTDSNIHMLSSFDMKMDIFKNPEQAGFKVTHKACCGVPNAYHYDLRVWCGQKSTYDNVTYASETCDNPNEYIVWDGTHTTEAANRYMAKQIFAGRYIYPKFSKLAEGCELSPLT